MWQNFQNYAGAWNFGPPLDSAKTVKQLVEELILQWGSGGWIDASNPEDFYEAPQLRLSTEKVCELLGWRTVYDFQQAITATVNWYRAFYAGADTKFLRDLCCFQIAGYCTEAQVKGLPWLS
jgi:CDP-glucose 4,6-dehydratase